MGVSRKYIFFLLIVLSAVSVIIYWETWKIYFQQDEWNGFGNVLYADRYGYGTLVRVYGSHLTPFSSLFFAFLFHLFGFRYWLYAWYGIIFHGVNAVLVCVLALKMTKVRMVSILASLLFLTAAVSQQAVTWYAASVSFLPAAFFLLISMIVFEEYLHKKQRKLLVLPVLVVL